MKLIANSIMICTVLAALAIAQPSQRYTVTDLGTLGGLGTNSNAFGINAIGWATGSSNLVLSGPQHAFLWYGGGHMFDLGTLGGQNCPTCNSQANGLNALGEAAIGS